MQTQPLNIEKLSIQKMPGLPRGLKTYEDISPDINIISGPNASGKSSTARVIRQLFSGKSIDKMQASSRFAINSEKWQIHIDSNQRKVQKEGVDAHLSGVPATETLQRYTLAFHELITSQEQDLARQIIQESAGGYDLDQAREELKYDEKKTTKSITEYKNLENSTENLHSIQKAQENLKSQEKKLEALKNYEQSAKEAGKLVELYKLVKEWINQKQEFELSKKRYEEFPSVMEKVTGNERDDIEGLEEEIENLQYRIDEAEKTIASNRETLDKLDFPADGISEQVLEDLDDKIEKLKELKNRIEDKDEQIAGAQEKAEQKLKNIDESLSAENFQGISLKGINKLHEFIDKALRVMTEKRFLETEIARLEKLIPEEDEYPDKIRKGIDILVNWLKQYNYTGISGKWLYMLAGAGVLTALLTLWLGPYGLLGLALIGLIIFLGLQKKTDNKAKIREDDYKETGLKEPDAWQTDQVIETLDYLSNRLSEVNDHKKVEEKLEPLKEELQQVKKRWQDVEDEYKELKKSLEAVPNLPDEDVKSYTGLYYFLKNTAEWQEQTEELESLKAEKNAHKQHFIDLLQKINALFRENNAKQVNDYFEAKSVYNHLKKTEEARKDAQGKIENEQRILEDKQGYLEEKQKKRKKIYDTLYLNEGDKAGVKNLVEQLEDYKEAKKDFQNSESLLNEKFNRMAEHSMYPSQKEKIDDISPDQVDEVVNFHREYADKLEDFKDEIREIKTNINSVKSYNKLELALKDKEEKLADLEGFYEKKLSSVTGSILVDELKEETAKQHQTPVFKKANALFNRITRGRYELRVDDQHGTEFKAFDTVLDEGQHLDQLSTGTRIQLILAVRLAFIEMQESGLKLPVLADELLANSDDARAKAIIEALVEISKEGRQVFYFTAQGDEVAKWQQLLDKNEEVDMKVFEITGEESEKVPSLKTAPIFESFEFEQNVPAPAGKTHHEYAKILEIPSFDLLSQPVSAIHLWYLIEDTNLLFECLKTGITNWGQLNSFVENGGVIQGLDETTWNRIQDKASALKQFQELYRQGRPQPIDRTVLENSDAVSDKFIDEVSQKLGELNGNPEKLLEALRNGEISRFSSRKTDELQEYLKEQDYLSDEEQFSKDEILVRMQAFISGKDVDKQELERMIENVFS